MSGLDLKAIHEALAAKIEAGIDNVGEFTVEAFPSTAARPTIQVWPDSQYVSYNETSGSEGLADVNVLVRVFLAGANIETEWIEAAQLLSAGTGHGSSIIDAIMTDRSLGGVVADAFAGTSRWNPEDGSIDVPVLIQVNKIGAAT